MRGGCWTHFVNVSVKKKCLSQSFYQVLRSVKDANCYLEGVWQDCWLSRFLCDTHFHLQSHSHAARTFLMPKQQQMNRWMYNNYEKKDQVRCTKAKGEKIRKHLKAWSLLRCVLNAPQLHNWISPLTCSPMPLHAGSCGQMQESSHDEDNSEDEENEDKHFWLVLVLTLTSLYCQLLEGSIILYWSVLGCHDAGLARLEQILAKSMVLTMVVKLIKGRFTWKTNIHVPLRCSPAVIIHIVLCSAVL